MKKLLVTSLTCLMMISCNQKENPLLSEFSTPFGVPPFEQIKPEHYMPAFEEGIRQHDAEIAAIIANPEAPTFKNTIEPLEFSGMLLTQVNLIFSSLTEAETNDELQAIAKEISPKLTEHYDNISLNGELFARIKTVYENRDKENLDTEQMKVLENHYKDFVRAGALLSEEDKATLREINKELAMLSIQYGDNALAESNAFELVIDNETDLAGLPEAVVTAMKRLLATKPVNGYLPSMRPAASHSCNTPITAICAKKFIKPISTKPTTTTNSTIKKSYRKWSTSV